ncbi:hypothetical protein [Gracilimonas sediminicola]|uniref:Uncharacterized protein n=1 Tax=Gracilimonas sediminicola TaxID=2952158 RepID=A0A9X2L0D2_9BACT|nr:hypothetical protein [Gracilimonas sediminicola]MCP9290018.1 hypothetical protein [Gracilimonas sediminicola]
MPVTERKTSHTEIDQDLEDGMVIGLQQTKSEQGSIRDAARACMKVVKPELDRLREMNKNLGTELKAEKRKKAQGSL